MRKAHGLDRPLHLDAAVRGRMEPRMGTTRKLASALGVNESWLAYGVGEERIDERKLAPSG